MNINSTGHSPKIQQGRPMATAIASEAQEGQPQSKDSVEFKLEIPKNFDIDLVKYTKYAGRVAPGLLSLGLNAPTVALSPVLNAISPARTTSAQHGREIWTNVLGTGAIGSAAGAFIGRASGNQIVGGILGGIAGLAVGGIRTAVAGKAKYPEIAEAAAQAKDGNSNKAFASGVALRKGYAAGIREAYMDGGQYADNTVDFLRGLAGFKPD